MKRTSVLSIAVITILMINVIVLEGCASPPLTPETRGIASPLSINKEQSETQLIKRPAYHNTSLSEKDTDSIWLQLNHHSSKQLLAMRQTTNDPTLSAWIELALLSKEKKLSTQDLANKLMAWRERFKTHPANQLIPDLHLLQKLQSDIPPKKIALLIPQSGNFKRSGKRLYEGFMNAYYADLKKGIIQQIKFYDTSQTQNITALYQQAIADGAEIIVGPLLKENVQELSRFSSLQAKTLALNYSDVLTQKRPNDFYEFGLLPEDETLQMATDARRSNLSHAIIIAPQSTWGRRLVLAFSTTWLSQGGSIEETWYFSSHENFAQKIVSLLTVNDDNNQEVRLKEEHIPQASRQDFDVIFLFANPKEARIIVPLLRYYHTKTTKIYADSSVYTRPTDGKENDLDGVTICDIPWQMRANYVKDNIQSDRLYAVGQDAYLLSHSLSRLTDLPNFPIYGTTGVLSLSLQHQIHRHLPCVTIHHGQIA